MALWYTPSSDACDTIAEPFGAFRTDPGHWEWPEPEYISTSPTGVKSHIYRAPYWVSDEPKKIYR